MSLILDKDNKSVLVSGHQSHLTPKEYSILAYLMENAGKTVSAEEIYQHAWNEVPFECKPIISVHIRHIREKIENNPSCPYYIDSLWGRGYRYNLR